MTSFESATAIVTAFMSIPRSWIRLESAVAVALAVVDVTEDVTLAAFEPYRDGEGGGGWVREGGKE